MARQHNSADETRQLRKAGARAAADLPDLSPETCRRIAGLLREPLNTYVAARRKRGAA